jgi:TonB family protein
MARGALFPASRYRLPTPQPILPSGTGDELVSFKTALPITIEKTGIPVPHTTPTLAPRKRPIQWIHALTAAPSGAGLEIGAQTLLPGAGNGTGELAQGDRGSTVTAAGGAVSIEGPLANRGVIKRVIPPYPLWAEEKGIVGQVRIYFTVDVSGHVAPTMRIDWTSGSPELDHLAMEALRQWQFAAAPPGTQRQWGYITFRFSLTQNSL